MVKDVMVKKHISLTENQLKFIVKKGGNISRYIRTLIDIEIGRDDAINRPCVKLNSKKCY